jgi:hypothetical protein
MIGVVTSIENDGKEIITAKKGMSVAVEIVNDSYPEMGTFGGVVWGEFAFR